MKKIDIYTSESCSYCYAAKEYFKQKNISYEEHNITKDSESRRELMRMGYRSVPIIIIDGEQILGFNKERISSLLE